MTVASQIIGSSAAIGHALAEADRLAPTSLPVVIYGPSGTGKELLARRVHDQSSRKAGPFVVIDCTKLPKDLVESTLFGHEKGAFTGAVAAREGLFELADGGTAFLDEVAELPVDQQVKLLRVLQEGEVHRVGASRPRAVDVRVVAATNRNLAEMTKAGDFREDLYYRLVGDRIALPPLHERGNDVVEIATEILKREAPHLSLTNEARELLLSYDWPGNIRQLQNIMVGSAARSTGRSIERDVIWDHIQRITHFVPTSSHEQARPQRVRGRQRRGVVTDVPRPDDHTDLEPSEAVLDFVRKHSPTKAAAIRAALDLTKSTCHRLLAGLESAGRVHRVGTGLKTEYVAVDEANGDQEPDEGTAVPASPPADAVTERVAALTERQASILQVLAMSPSMSVGELRGKLADPPSLRTLRADLLRLKQAGLVSVEGAGPRTRWLLSRRP